MKNTEHELRKMAAQSVALLPQLEMSEADAAEFLATATPRQRAAMSKMSEQLEAMSPAERLEALREIAKFVAAMRADKRGMQ